VGRAKNRAERNLKSILNSKKETSAPLGYTGSHLLKKFFFKKGKNLLTDGGLELARVILMFAALTS
jgi:hypothetical protein